MADKLSVEEKLKQKLEAGEIDQEEYENLMKKFKDLDLLGSKVGSGRSKQNYSYSGSRTMSGGEIAEPVRVSGKLHVTDSLSCPKFSVSGSASIDGSLTVTGPARVSGSLRVGKEAKFGEAFKLSGKAHVQDSVFLTDAASISGKLIAGDRIASDSPIKVSGKLDATTLQSTSSVKLSGKVVLSEGLKAKSFITSGGASYVGADLEADVIEIAKKYREKVSGENYDPEFEAENVESIPDLGRFISKMVTEFIPKVVTNVVGIKTGGPPKTFSIDGNVVGKTVDISYCKVNGDVIADEVIIGPGVEIKGKIIYSKTITVPEETNYEIVAKD